MLERVKIVRFHENGGPEVLRIDELPKGDVVPTVGWMDALTPLRWRLILW
jgi:hypothetical protein